MQKRNFVWLLIFGLLMITGLSSSAQFGLRAVVVNELLNIRVSPAIGANVIATVEAGFVFDIITGRSGDGEWLRVEYECNEGWINIAPLVILEGDINALPLADPRSIPYGGFDAPRSGFTNQVGVVRAAATDGLRIRSGPSTAYPTLANINYNQAFTITGRTRCNTWYQVSFEGTLGWISAGFMQILGSGDLNSLAIDGLIADTAPPSGEGLEDYIATLRLMLARLDLAQESLNQIRASWTDSALTGRASCQPYPAQPSDFNIPSPLLAAHYGTLNPLLNDFNTAMFNVRQAIDLFIQVCNQPGTGNPVGQATVQGALNIVNEADNLFASLRQRLNELIPEFEVSPEECLLQFNNKYEIVPRIGIGGIYADEFNQRTYARGYCFDAFEEELINLQVLPIPPAQLKVFAAISPLDNPTDFVTVVEGSTGSLLAIGPVIMPRTTTYLLILADLGDTSDGRYPYGEYAFMLTDLTFNTNIQTLVYDTATNSVTFQAQATAPASGGGGPSNQPAPSVCPNLSLSCSLFFSCDEARACLAAGNFSLDTNGDGVPCNEPGNLLGAQACQATSP